MKFPAVIFRDDVERRQPRVVARGGNDGLTASHFSDPEGERVCAAFVAAEKADGERALRIEDDDCGVGVFTGQDWRERTDDDPGGHDADQAFSAAEFVLERFADAVTDRDDALTGGFRIGEGPDMRLGNKEPRVIEFIQEFFPQADRGFGQREN